MLVRMKPSTEFERNETMTKFLSSAAILILLMSAAMAESPVPSTAAPNIENPTADRKTFYMKDIGGDWTVYGYKFKLNFKDGGMNDSCVAELSYADGSFAQLWMDIPDDELWIGLVNMTWNLDPEKDKKGNIRLNMYKGKAFVDGGGLEYYRNTKTRLTIPDVKRQVFMKAMLRSDRLVVVVPTDNTNMTLTWGTNAPRLLSTLKECIDEYRTGTSALPDFDEKFPKVSPSKPGI